MKGAPPWQDWLFERTTMVFALFVLLVLLGIIAALTWAAIPAFSRFGFGSCSRMSGTR
jgi:ABC-type phosphate transport system permease subunit